MKLFKIFNLTLLCCMLMGISHAKAGDWESSSPHSSEGISNILNSRFGELTRGVNLNHWFAQQLEPQFKQNYITDADLATIADLGFEHVRLPIDPTLLFDENNPEILNAEYLGYLDNALDNILGHNLSAIVTLSPPNEFKSRLAKEDNFVDAVTKFWKALATHLNTRNPEQIFLETLNEPAFNFFLRHEPGINPAERWNEVQGKLLAAMREGSPDATLIAKAYDWDGIDSLFALTLVQDPNVVYNFHFYEPMPFTHQGADWTREFTNLRDLPYPYNAENCAAAVNAIVDDEKAKDLAQFYCDQKWDAAKLEARIAKAADWANENHVLLTANEFGVYRSYVDNDDLLAWIRDTRSSFEKYNIGWTMWEYTEGFGLVKEKEEGVRIVYEDVVDALGGRRRIPEPSALAGLALVAVIVRGKRGRGE